MRKTPRKTRIIIFFVAPIAMIILALALPQYIFDEYEAVFMLLVFLVVVLLYIWMRLADE